MIVANIAVYKCDDCDLYVSVTTAEEEQQFGNLWFTSLTKDFCPTCKSKIENLSAMEIAEELDQCAFNMLDAPASAEEAKCH